MTGADILAELAALRAAGGGRMRIPAGHYQMPAPLVIQPVNAAVSSAANITIEGDGHLSTVLDFSALPAGTDGISASGMVGRFSLGGFTVRGAPRHGVNLSGSPVPSGPNYIHRFDLDGILVEQSGANGFNFTNTYMGDVRNCESRSNGGRGYSLNGFHTSMLFSRCWASGEVHYGQSGIQGNAGSGWYVNNATYCHLDTCASDKNGTGYIVSNVAGVRLTSCGAESNLREGVLLASSSDGAENIADIIENINGLSIANFFAFDNSLLTPGGYANFIGILTRDDRPITVTTEVCVSRRSAAPHIATVYNGTGGLITVAELNNYYGAGTSVVNGNVMVKRL